MERPARPILVGREVRRRGGSVPAAAELPLSVQRPRTDSATAWSHRVLKPRSRTQSVQRPRTVTAAAG